MHALLANNRAAHQQAMEAGVAAGVWGEGRRILFQDAMTNPYDAPCTQPQPQPQP